MTLPSRIMRLRLLPSYPIRDDAGTAIAISKSGGVQTTSIDYAKQSLTAGIADPSTATVLVLRATGAYERARLDQLVFPAAGQRTPRGDADYTVLTTDRFVALTASLTAARVWTLPAASAVAGGTPIAFGDESGGVTSTNTITITRAGSDTINGGTTFVLNTARMGVALVSDGISKWSVALAGTSTVVTRSLADGALSADATGRAKMADGFLSADTTGRAKMADKFVTNAKLDDMAQATIKGRASGAGTGVPTDLTGAQVRAIAEAGNNGFRNLIINAGFRINQRAFAGGALSAGVYGHDRWKAGAGGGNYSVSAGVATIASGTIVQVIDGLSIETTGTYVINWTGTATLTVDGVSRAKGATFTLTRGSNCTIEVSSGTLSELQVEFGTLSSVFETRPAAVEFTLCEYYYRLVPINHRFGAGGVAIFQVPLTWSMRATPVSAVVTSGSAANVTSSSLSANSRSGGNFSITSAASGDTYVINAVYSLSSEL